MSGDANVGSIDAVREFRGSVSTFLHEARDALITYDLEARRALEWLVHYAPKMWQEEIRKTQEKVTQLNIAFQSCRAQKLPGGGQPACLEEKKLLDRARAKLAYAEEKLQKTKKWAQAAERQAIEYKGRSSQLMGVLDGEVPNAIALLDRVLNSLEAYVGLQQSSGSRGSDGIDAAASVAQPQAEEKTEAAKPDANGAAPQPAAEVPAVELPAAEVPAAQVAAGAGTAVAAEHGDEFTAAKHEN